MTILQQPAREIARPIEAATQVLNLATKLHDKDSSEKKLPSTKVVRLLLLRRIQNDLRCCVILVERGYALQAASLAAGIFEAWVTLVSIKTDVDAVKWLSHAREDKGFGNIYALTKDALESIVRDTKDLKKFYGMYRQLCMAKHLNPIVERARGYDYDVSARSVEFRLGPDMSELAIPDGWLALVAASRFAFMGLLTIADSQETPAEMTSEFQGCLTKLNAVQSELAGRWPEALAIET